MPIDGFNAHFENNVVRSANHARRGPVFGRFLRLDSINGLRAKKLCAALLMCGAAYESHAQTPPELRLAIDGAAQKIFDPRTDACAPVDMPDMPARAFRAADGAISLFALHYEARALRGPSLDKLKIDCKSALNSSNDPNPALYDGRRFLTATWTPDGTRIAALVHNEYHADHHPGRCVYKEDLPCWWNAILSFKSQDAGATFKPSEPLVVAAPPFRQDVEQGRHRGFFQPSNMFAKGAYVYAFIVTTGWSGQNFGACLLRNPDPLNSAGWRAYDGVDFTVRWDDPYAPASTGKGAGALDKNARGNKNIERSLPQPKPCQSIAPFIFAIGSVVRHRGSDAYIALWESPRQDNRRAGLYYATSRDLLRWSDPSLLSPGASINDACAGGANRDGAVNAYPALLDPNAEGRNFDDVGDQAFVYYTHIKMSGCSTGARALMRLPIKIAAAPRR